MRSLLKKSTERLKGNPEPKKETQIKFPSKSGTDAAQCIGLLDIYGSLFCLDNSRILFKDENGESKVLRPECRVPADPGKYTNLDAFATDDGFAVRWQGNDYHYKADFEVVSAFSTNLIKLKNIKQHIYPTTNENNQLCSYDDIGTDTKE